MKCECFIDCFCSCEIIVALVVLLFWLFFTIKEAKTFIDDNADDDNKIKNIGIYIKVFSITGIKAFLLRWWFKNYKQDDNKNIEDCRTPDKKTTDLLSIAKTLIETATKNETITFSELCKKGLEEEWKGRKWLNYIARRLDIIGHCCAYDANHEKAYEKIDDCFPFLNGLTREKYSYKINSGFWQQFWKDLLPIKSYEDQTEENVKEFQQQICDKISKMEQNDIDEFLKKLKTFEPIYEDLKKNNKT